MASTGSGEVGGVARRKAAEVKPLSIGGAPTVAGLAKQGRHLAYLLPDGRYHVTAEGHKVIGAALRANAQERIMRGEGEWRRPPSSGKVQGHG